MTDLEAVQTDSEDEIEAAEASSQAEASESGPEASEASDASEAPDAADAASTKVSDAEAAEGDAPDGGTASDGDAAADGDAEAEAPEGAEAAEAAPTLGPGEDLDDETLLQETAALLFASPDALSLNRLVELLQRPARARVRGALAAVGAKFEEAGLPYVVREIAGGWRVMTDPDLGEVVQRLARVQRPEKVTPAMLETLSIVAYRQPVTKAEVEAIRGVQSGAMLRSLVDRRLVRVTGRADQPGSPLQYGTTREFLERFGLASLKDLPRDGELATP